jgi:hypothetical protein
MINKAGLLYNILEKCPLHEKIGKGSLWPMNGQEG